jgi:hypothetical protein
MVTLTDQTDPNYDSPEIAEIGSFADLNCGEGAGISVDFFTWWL